MAGSKAAAAPLDIPPRLRQQYLAGETTLQQLAHTFGVSVSTVWRELKRRGVCRGSRRGRPPDGSRDPVVLDLAAQGLTRRQIAQKAGVSPEWVRCILARHGLSVSLKVLQCNSCGAPVASGHKAHQKSAVSCLACLAQRPGPPLAQRLRTLRLAANLSRAQLSARCGLSLAVLGIYERGEGLPSPESLSRLARALGVGAAALAGAGREGAPGADLSPPGPGKPPGGNGDPRSDRSRNGPAGGPPSLLTSRPAGAKGCSAQRPTPR